MNLATIHRYRLLLLGFLIFCLGFALRIYHLGFSPISGDESINTIRALWLYRGLFSHHLQDFYGLIIHQHSPTELAIISLSFPLGFTEATIRFPSLLLNSLIPVIVIKYFRRYIHSTILTLLATLIFAISPMLVGWSKEAAYDNLVLIYSVLVLYWIIKFAKEPNKRNLIRLAVVYGFSFWIILFYGLLFPLIAFLVVKYRSRFSNKDLIRVAFLFLSISGLYLIPYFLGAYFVPASTGVRNLLSRPLAWHPMENFQYYWTTYLAHPTVIVSTAILVSGMFSRKIREDKFYLNCVLYVLSYLLFFIFLLSKTSPYLSALYPAMILGAVRVIHLSRQKVGYIILTIWLGVLLCFSFQYLIWQHADTPAIWGYAPHSEIKKAAYLIRKCTSGNSLVISDVDGYETSLYFNRKYPRIQEKVGLSATLSQYLDQSVQGVYLSPVSELKDSRWLDKKYVFSDSSVLYLRSCDQEVPLDDSAFYKQYWTVNKAIGFYR